MIEAPTTDEFKRGFTAFQAREKRDAMYKTATFLVGHFWGHAAEVADSLGVLLLTWNQAFYRYGPFDFDKLEEAIALNQRQLDGFRARDISSYSPADDQAIGALFATFLGALRLCEGTKKGTSSPVAVAKALHLLAPRFFPLWDAEIATKYGCRYSRGPAEKYIVFLRKTQKLADRLAGTVVADEGGKSLIKLIDEYNYAKYTKGWI
jgi:hypothetical protein